MSHAQSMAFSGSASETVHNVDPREAERYSALAATWWDCEGPFWPLHRLNELRVHYLRGVLAALFDRDPHGARPFEGLDVLDVGCGGGILSESMARLGARVHGIDVVERNIAIARSHAAGSGLEVEYEHVTVDALAGRAARYDIVLNMEVVEHVPDMTTFMSDCTRLVRPGGAMALATINRTLKSFVFAIVGAEYVLRWLPRGTHRWVRFVKPSEVESALQRGGLRPVDRVGVRVNPFNRRFSVASDLSVNFMVVATREVSA